MKKVFQATVIIDFGDGKQTIGAMDIKAMLKQKGIITSDSVDASPMVLEFKMEEVKK